MRGGYIRETSVVQAITCESCDNPHDADIVFENEQYGYFCAECGFVPIERPAISGLLPNLSKIVAGLADVFDCKRRKATPVAGRTWRVGVLECIAGDVAIYFIPRLRTEEDLLDLATALSREVNSPFRLILTAEGTLPFSGTKTVRLEDVVEFDRDTSNLIKIADPITIVEAPILQAVGAPNLYVKTLLPLIEARVREGAALKGRNEEARAILTAYEEQHPNAQPPSLPTIKRYLTKVRGGS